MGYVKKFKRRLEAGVGSLWTGPKFSLGGATPLRDMAEHVNGLFVGQLRRLVHDERLTIKWASDTVLLLINHIIRLGLGLGLGLVGSPR